MLTLLCALAFGAALFAAIVSLLTLTMLKELAGRQDQSALHSRYERYIGNLEEKVDQAIARLPRTRAKSPRDTSKRRHGSGPIDDLKAVSE